LSRIPDPEPELEPALRFEAEAGAISKSLEGCKARAVVGPKWAEILGPDQFRAQI